MLCLKSCPGRSILPEWTFGEAEPELAPGHPLNARMFSVHPGLINVRCVLRRTDRGKPRSPARQAGPTKLLPGRQDLLKCLENGALYPYVNVGVSALRECRCWINISHDSLAAGPDCFEPSGPRDRCLLDFTQSWLAGFREEWLDL